MKSYYRSGRCNNLSQMLSLLILWSIYVSLLTGGQSPEEQGEFSVSDDENCKKIENSTLRMIYFKGERQKIVLPCDTTGSVKVLPKFNPPKFLWAKYIATSKHYVFYPEFDFNKYTYHNKENNITELEIDDFDPETDSTLWCCLILYNGNFGLKWARASYAVLSIRDYKVTMSAPASNISDLWAGQNLTLTCSKGPSVFDKIQPAFFWKISSATHGEGHFYSSKITMRLSSKSNGVKIQCGNEYQRDNANGRPLLFKSNELVLNVAYPPEFVNDATSTNREPIILYKPISAVTLVASIQSNPPATLETTKVIWSKVEEASDDSTDLSEYPSMEHYLISKCLNPETNDSNRHFSLLTNETKGGKFMFPKVNSRNGTVHFYLIVKSFEDADSGCYHVLFETEQHKIQRFFYLMTCYSSPTISVLTFWMVLLSLLC